MIAFTPVDGANRTVAADVPIGISSQFLKVGAFIPRFVIPCPMSGADSKPREIPILRNHEPRDRGTRQSQTCADEHYNAESKYKYFLNGFLDGGVGTEVESSGNLQA